jgi:hypothetical protein
MSRLENHQTSSSPAPSRRRWWRRLPWRGAVFILAGVFVVTYPVYTYLDESITGGIHQRGDLIEVDLKAMSSFEMDQDHGTNADIPKRYRELDGKRVMLTGQMYEPYSAEGKIRNFTLVYSISQCCFNGPPKVQHLVDATLLPGRDAEYYEHLVSVVGTLHVGVQSAQGRLLSVYRIDVERVEGD